MSLTFIGLMFLADVYRSRSEATRSLWDEQAGWTIFRTAMSLRTFNLLSRQADKTCTPSARQAGCLS